MEVSSPENRRLATFEIWNDEGVLKINTKEGTRKYWQRGRKEPLWYYEMKTRKVSGTLWNYCNRRKS